MQHEMNILYHRLRAGYHWNRMAVIADRTGQPHQHLMQIHEPYRISSKRYNESIAFLQQAGVYTTARAAMKVNKLRQT